MYDIVIVGGNLSGASAAINASKKGAKVAIIERNKEPFNPAHCGEGIADVTYDYYEFGKSGGFKNIINNFVIDISDIKKYTFKLSNHKMYIFDRNLVEKYYLKTAEKNGAELFLGRRMMDYKPPNKIILDKNKTIEGKIIIDASGIACHVGTKMGLNTKLKPEDVGVCLQCRVEADFIGDQINLWYHKPYAPFGYSWLFPINKRLANVGLGIPGGMKVKLEDLLTNYIRFITNNDYKIKRTFRCCVPSGLPLDPIAKDNVLFVGDAARLTNSATGAGIQNAIFSGSLAGLIAVKYINNEITSLQPYLIETERLVSKLKKTYYSKSKLISDEKFISTYKKAFSMLNPVNKLFPGFFQNYVAKILKKDQAILEKYQ